MMKKIIILVINLFILIQTNVFAEKSALSNQEFIKAQLELSNKILAVSEEQLKLLEPDHDERVKLTTISSITTALFTVACMLRFKTKEAYLCGVPTGIPSVVYGFEVKYDSYSKVKLEIELLKKEIRDLEAQLAQ